MRNIVFINSHPIQYFAPLYQVIAKESDINLKVIYLSNETVEGYQDPQFGVNFKWDIPLLQGYDFKFLKNHSWKPSIKNGFFGLINWGLIPELKMAKKKSIVIIHGWGSLSNVLACYVAFICGHTVCLRGESAWKQEIKKPTYKRILKNGFLRVLLFPFVHKFLFIGQQNKSFYKNLGISDEDLVFTPYSVDNDRFRTEYRKLQNERDVIRSGFKIHGSRMVILFSGKYIQKKRPMDLLRAFHLMNADADFLIMMGEGGLRKDLENYIGEHNLTDRVMLTGFINQSEISKYYTAADIFVMCSEVGETWGLSINEAMNFSLPLIVSELTGCSDDLVRNGENGYVFETGNINELANRIEKIGTLSEANRQLMGERSANIVAGYSYQKTIDGLKII